MRGFCVSEWPEVVEPLFNAIFTWPSGKVAMISNSLTQRLCLAQLMQRHFCAQLLIQGLDTLFGLWSATRHPDSSVIC
jgi:hypothetical protein